jgi:L-lactate dehydrogenase complex protein LldG
MSFIEHISQSLGRSRPPASLSSLPPSIEARIARFVGADADLVSHFVTRAVAAKLHVTVLSSDQTLASELATLLAGASLKNVIVTRCATFEQSDLIGALQRAGIDARYWDECSLDTSYEVDVGITDVWSAVAETGSIVVKSSAAHGRAVSLVPPYHIAVVRKAQIVPDLIDLMAQVRAEGSGAGIVIITGPSKTADIEMNLVTGVHGPGEVHVFVID